MKWRPKALEGHKKSCGKRELERSRGWKHPRWIIYAPIKTDEALISLSLSLTRIFSIGNSFWLLRLLSGNWQRFGCLWLVDHTKRCGYRHNLTTSSSRQALHFIELTLLPTCSWKKKKQFPDLRNFLFSSVILGRNMNMLSLSLSNRCHQIFMPGHVLQWGMCEWLRSNFRPWSLVF